MALIFLCVSKLNLSQTSLFHCTSCHGSLQMLCTQYLLMFSHLESLVGKLFQVILFMIHSRIIIDWCVTVSWIPGGTTSLGYQPAYTHYWEDNCIWFNNTNLLKQTHYLAHNLQPEFNVSFSVSPFSSSPLSPLFLLLIPSSLPSFSLCLPLKSWASSRSLSYHLCYSLKDEYMQITLPWICVASSVTFEASVACIVLGTVSLR